LFVIFRDKLPRGDPGAASTRVSPFGLMLLINSVVIHEREYQRSGVTANKPPLGVDNNAGKID
jgi:hypothetical protein